MRVSSLDYYFLRATNSELIRNCSQIGALYARNTFPAKKRKIFGRDIIFARGAERGRETTSGQNIPVGKIDPDVIASAVSKGYLTWEHSVDSNLIAINGKSVLDHICCAAAAAGVETSE